MRKINIEIDYPWDEDELMEIEELRDELEGWSGAEWAGYIDDAKISIIEEELKL